MGGEVPKGASPESRGHALRDFKSQISNGKSEIWDLESEIPSEARIGVALKVLAHRPRLEGLAHEERWAGVY
jgi:hypothetical protein